MANLWQPSLQPILDDNGDPVSGGKWYFYLTGTTTLATIFSSQAGDTPLANPVIADTAGRVPLIYLDKDATYRARRTDEGDIQLGADIDPVAGFDESAAGSALQEAETAATSAVAAAATATTQAGIATTKAGEASASAIAAALSQTEAANGAAAAVAAGNIVADVAAGEAATSDGEYFLIENADGDLQLYKNVAGTGTAQTYVMASASSIETLTDKVTAQIKPKGSIHFPRKQGTKAPNDFVALQMQDTNNLEGAMSETQSGFIAMFDMPAEAMYGNYSYEFCGSDQNAAINFNLAYFSTGSSSGDAGKLVASFGGTGTGNTAEVNVTPNGERCLLSVTRDGQDFTARIIHPEAPDTIINGTTVTEASFTGINRFRDDFWTIGGAAKAATGPTSLGNGWNDTSERYWIGNIEFVGIHTVGLSDADMIAIAKGADPAEIIGFGNWRFYREWPEGLTDESLSAPARVTSDTTPALVKIQAGDVDIEDGPNLRPLTDAKSLICNYVQRGYIMPQDADTGLCYHRFQGISTGLSGPLYLRFWNSDNTLALNHFIGNITGDTFDFEVQNIPAQSGGFKMGEIYAANSGISFAFSNRVSAGEVDGLYGQSQVTRFAIIDTQGFVPNPPFAMSIVRNVDEDKNAIGQQGTFQRYIVGLDAEGISDGLAGFATRRGQVTDIACSIVADEVSGLPSEPWLVEEATSIPHISGGTIEITDTVGTFAYFGREWAQSIALFQFGCAGRPTAWLFNQYSANNYGDTWIDQIGKPLFFGGEAWQEHYVTDGTLFQNAPKLALVETDRHVGDDVAELASGHAGGGNIGYGKVRDQVRILAADHGLAKGPVCSGLGAEILGGAEQGPHVREDAEPGNRVYGEYIAETALRAVGLSDSQDPSIIGIKRPNAKTIRFVIDLPNGGSLRTWANNKDADGKTIVDGFEVNINGTENAADWTWDDTILKARISSYNTVDLTLVSGDDWPAAWKAAYLYGGPLYTGGGGGDDLRIRDVLYEIAPIGEGTGFAVAGSTTKEWTQADLIT